jgi:hypothetical protein
MSTTSATPPATRRIARSYLTDLVAAAQLPSDFESLPRALVAGLVEQLLDRAVVVRHAPLRAQLVLTFDLADDPAGWSTSSGSAGPPLAGSPAGLDGQPENRDYPGQPGERVTLAEAL